MTKAERERLQQERIDEYVRREVEKAPPLSEDDRIRLRALLTPVREELTEKLRKRQKR